METIISKTKKLPIPSTFTTTRFLNSPIEKGTETFGYGMTRSARMVGVYIKGNINSMLAVVIENSGEIVTPSEAITLMKLPENKDKRFDVNGLSYKNSAFCAIAFIKF